MPTDARSTHKNYPVPHTDNTLPEDMARIGTAIEMLDVDVDALEQAVSGKASAGHAHDIADVTGLQNELATLLAAINALPSTLEGMSDTETAGVTQGMVLQYLTGRWQAVAARAEHFGLTAVTGLSANNVQDAIAELKAGINGIINAAPETLDTLNELAAALADDPNFATTISAQIGQKANTADLGPLATQTPEDAREELETEVRTRINAGNPEFHDGSEWKKFRSGGAVPIGSAIPWMSDLPPNEFWIVVKGVNQAFSRALFPQLFDHYNPERTVTITNGSAVVTGIGSNQGFAPGMPVEGAGVPAGATILSVDGTAQVTLSANATANSTKCRVFRFGNGNGSTTASFPSFAGRYFRGWDAGGTLNPDAGGELGVTQEDAFQNVTAEFSGASRIDHVANNASGAFGIVTGSRSQYVSSNSASANSPVGLDFDASRVARTSDETRPKTIIGTWIVKAADGVDDPAVLQAAQVVQDLAQAQENISQLETDLAAAEGQLLGVGQAWQNVSGSRALNTAYQNTTGRPLEVCVTMAGSGSTAGNSRLRLQVSEDNVTWVAIGWAGNNANYGGAITAVIPADHYYKATDTGFSVWTELRG